MATHTCPQCGSSLPAQARFCGQCGFSMPAGAPPPAPAPAPAAPPPAAQKPLARTMALGSPAFPDASPVTSPSPHRHQEGPVERPAPPLMNDEETVRRDLSSVLREIEAAEAKRRGEAPPSIPTPVVPPPDEETMRRPAAPLPAPPAVPAPAAPAARDLLHKTFVDPAPLGAIVGAASAPPAQAQLLKTVADPAAQEAARAAMSAAMTAMQAGGLPPPNAQAPQISSAPQTPPQHTPPAPSPLSHSVMGFGSSPPPAAASGHPTTQASPRNMGTALGIAPPTPLPPPPNPHQPPPAHTAGRNLGTAIGIAPETPLSHGPPPQQPSAPAPAPHAGRKLGTAIGLSPETPLGGPGQGPPPPGYPYPHMPPGSAGGASEPRPGSAPPPAKPNMKTMLGVAPEEVAALQEQQRRMAAASQHQQPPQQPYPPGAAGPGGVGGTGGPPGASRTMLGVAVPGVAPTAPGGQPQPGAAPMGANRTMLGVAMPGIAPTGAAPRSPVSPNAMTNWQPQPAPVALPPRPLAPEDEAPPEAPALARRSGVPIVAVVAILAVLLLVGGGAIVMMLGRGTPLVARPELDEQGKEAVRVTCDACADGVVVGIGPQKAPLKGHTALVTLAEPLAVGDNRLVVRLERGGKTEDVKVTVPVAFRIRADLTTLTSRPPVITVRVEAAAGTQATIDGKALAIDATGKGSYAIDVSSETKGTSDDTKVLDKKIPFVITTRTGKAETGTLTAKTPIVPLHVDAPLAHTTVADDSVTVAGQTTPGATVTLDGRPVAVDDKGVFVHSEKLLHDGETAFEIVAQSGQLAPRSATVRVVRVGSLEALAKELDGQAPLALPALLGDVGAIAGKLVAIEGEVVDARPAPSQSIFLVDVKKGCDRGECLVRVVAAGDVKLAKKDTIRVYGRATKAVTSGGKTVPEVEADFYLKARR